MKKYFYLFIVLLSITIICPQNIVLATAYTTETNLDSFFGNESGCAVFLDDDKKEYKVYNPQMINEKVSPCSTFKIVLTLAGLKYGVLKNENTLIKWDGIKRSFDNWNQDLTLKDAFRYSAGWYFAKVAEMIGHNNLTQFVKSINYGNCDTSSGGKFWLDSSLKISPKEQVDFLRRLLNGNLDINPSYIDTLKQIMCSEENKISDDYILGKTGSNGNNIGWFVGKYKSTYFAIRLIEGENVSGLKAREILKSLIINGKI
ncbi:MAG: putative beta-lactamase YbxI [Eubacteriales bacterium SKADARSKE-1]|nr:putative beta-lactamase YbxI [Eubacteriales bacterium SKADARSKE-1]